MIIKKRVAVLALGFMFLIGCNNPSLETNNQDVEKEDFDKVEKERLEKKKRIEYAISQYVDGVSPLYIDNILLVNKDYGIPDGFAEGLNEELLEQFEKMKIDAEKDGLKLNIRSGFRTFETQKTLYSNYIKRDGEELANRYSARPGYSEHQTGLAIDISNGDGVTSIGDWFTNTPQAKWLYENAYKYGFVLRYPEGKEDVTGYKYESWHYRYVGVEHSKYFNQNNLTLEEYLGVK